MPDLIPVTFQGDALGIVDAEEPFVPLKAVCDALGLDAARQAHRLRADRRFNCRLMSVVAADGAQRTMFCIPLSKLTAWLFMVNVNKVHPDARPKLEAWQTDAEGVLTRHFFGRTVAADPEEAVLPPGQRVELPAHFRELLRAWVRDTRPLWPIVRRYYDRGLSNSEIGKLMDRSRGWVSNAIRQMDALGILTRDPARMERGSHNYANLAAHRLPAGGRTPGGEG